MHQAAIVNIVSVALKLFSLGLGRHQISELVTQGDRRMMRTLMMYSAQQGVNGANVEANVAYFMLSPTLDGRLGSKKISLAHQERSNSISNEVAKRRKRISGCHLPSASGAIHHLVVHLQDCTRFKTLHGSIIAQKFMKQDARVANLSGNSSGRVTETISRHLGLKYCVCIQSFLETGGDSHVINTERGLRQGEQSCCVARFTTIKFVLQK